MATPYDAHTELLRSVISREGALGSLGIVGLPPLKDGEEVGKQIYFLSLYLLLCIKADT
jgi:hypothetical protein